MKILLVGGGSGGHVTPVIAVAKEIRELHPRAELVFWTDRKYYASSIQSVEAVKGLRMPVKKLAAGKLRRYTNFKFFDYIRHFGMVLGNFVDAFKIFAGCWQSFWRLNFNRPDVIFLKGGYVCLPVGIVAKFLKIPYVIHDSDAAPGLTNRVLAGKAAKIATGMPLDFYKYPEGKAIWTGIPISADFKPATKTEQGRAKKELGFDLGSSEVSVARRVSSERGADKPLLVVTGGSLGAQHVNEAVIMNLPELLKICNVALITGKSNYESAREMVLRNCGELELVGHFKMLDFTTELSKYFTAADIVVSRAGASTVSELASMKKAVVLVPNQKLPGFHQVKNAENFVKAGAAIMVKDAEEKMDERGLLKAVQTLASDADLRKKYGSELGKFAKNNAAKELALIVLAVGKK